MKNILLLSTVLPCNNYSGGIIIEQMLNYLLDDGYKISFFCLKNKSLNERVNNELLRKIKLYTFDDDSDNSLIVKEMEKIISRDKISSLFLVIVREKTMQIILDIYNKTFIPYYVFSGDPFEWVLKYQNNSKKVDKKILQLRKEVFSKAKCIFCGSDEMAKYYKKIFKTNTSALYTSFKSKDILKRKKHSRDVIKIGFSGQPYATDAISAFIKTLDNMGWKFDDKDIYFYYYGSSDISFLINSFNCDNIKVNKWLNQDDLILEMNKCDYLYCPYFFSKDRTFKLVSKYSFPSKIVTYLVSGTPIIIHAPKYSSIYKFLNHNKFMYFITSSTFNLNKKVKKIFQDEMINNYVQYNNVYRKNFFYQKVKEKFLNEFKVAVKK